MARTNGIDTMSYAELLALQEKIAAAIIERKSEDARVTKEQLRAMAEKAGFKLAGKFDDPRLGECRLMVLNRSDSP